MHANRHCPRLPAEPAVRGGPASSRPVSALQDSARLDERRLPHRFDFPGTRATDRPRFTDVAASREAAASAADLNCKTHRAVRDRERRLYSGHGDCGHSPRESYPTGRNRRSSDGRHVRVFRDAGEADAAGQLSAHTLADGARRYRPCLAHLNGRFVSLGYRTAISCTGPAMFVGWGEYGGSRGGVSLAGTTPGSTASDDRNPRHARLYGGTVGGDRPPGQVPAPGSPPSSPMARECIAGRFWRRCAPRL